MDKNEFASIIETKKASILRTAEKHIGGLGIDAEDLIQEAYIKSLNMLHRFDGKNPTGWFVTIMRNHSIDMRRKRKIEVLHYDNTMVDSESSFLSMLAGVSYNEGYQKLICDEVWAVIDLLPLTWKVSFVPSIQGYKINEISHINTKSPITTRVHIHKSRKKLLGMLV